MAKDKIANALRRAELKKARHWAVAMVFADAEEAGMASPGWEPFAKKIEEATGKKIPTGTLKYWYGGYSEPKVSELEAMAAGVGLELDLLRDTVEKPEDFVIWLPK